MTNDPTSSGRVPERNAKKTVDGKRAAPGEAMEIFLKIQQMKKMLQEQIDALHVKGKAHNVDVEKLLHDASLISMDKWDSAHREQEKLLERLENALKPAGVKSKKKDTSALTKERKGKTLGARRNWMPMR